MENFNNFDDLYTIKHGDIELQFFKCEDNEHIGVTVITEAGVYDFFIPKTAIGVSK
jgi:hypothetical protein